MKRACDRFDLFIQGNDEALDQEWLEEVVNSLRTEMKLSPLQSEGVVQFANFPGYQRGVWKLCEQGHVYYTGLIVRGGESISIDSQGCTWCCTGESALTTLGQLELED